MFLVEDVHLWLELWMFILNCAFLTFILDLRAQGDYLGRGGGGRAGTAQEYVANPRAMPGGNYGPSRVESELVAQYGGGRSGAGGASAYAGGQQASVYGGIGGGRGLAGIFVLQVSHFLSVAKEGSLCAYCCNSASQIWNLKRQLTRGEFPSFLCGSSYEGT